MKKTRMERIKELDQRFQDTACFDDDCLCNCIIPQAKNFFLNFCLEKHGFSKWKCRNRFRLEKTSAMQKKHFHSQNVDFCLVGYWGRERMKQYADDMYADGKMSEEESQELVMWSHYFRARQKQIESNANCFEPEIYLHAWCKSEASDVAKSILHKNCGWCAQNKYCPLLKVCETIET